MMNHGYVQQNGYGQRGEFHVPKQQMCFDNKAMVTSLPSTTVVPQPQVRLNITDPDKSSTQHSRSPTRFRKRIRLPYAINAFLGFSVFSLIVLLELGFIPAKKTGFYCKDPSLSYEFTGDTITSTTLLIGSLLILPGSVLILIEYLDNGWNPRFRNVWYIYKECLVGCSLVLLITEIFKVLIGEHRPHFFDICKPDTAVNCTTGEFVKSFECTDTSKYNRFFLSDLSRSFPSGHSSLSVFVAVYCSFIIQIRVATNQTGSLFKPFLISVCLCWSFLCSLSRITDKRHHWWDVAVGMLIGVLGAFYSISIIIKKLKTKISTTSTTSLVDIQNINAKSEII